MFGSCRAHVAVVQAVCIRSKQATMFGLFPGDRPLLPTRSEEGLSGCSRACLVVKLLSNVEESSGWLVLSISGLQKAVMGPKVDKHYATWSKAITASLCNAVGSYQQELHAILFCFGAGGPTWLQDQT